MGTTPPAPGWRQSRVTGHFGELLQGRIGADVVLVTLPCPGLGVTVRWRPGPGFLLSQHPALLPANWLRAIFRAVQRRAPSGVLVLRANLEPGAGAGGSTAAILATARALGLRDTVTELALCLSLEGASDPLMLSVPERVLWASRRGAVIARGPALPRFEVLGGLAGQLCQTDPGDDHFADIADLVRDWHNAGGDRVRMAAIATDSARRNVELRGGTPLAPLEDAARATGALGIVAAHTGAARGLLFAPGTCDRARTRAALREAGLRQLIGFQTEEARQ